MNLLKGFSRTALAMATAMAIGITTQIPSAQAETLEAIQEAGQVRIGILVDFPPFGFMNENNEPDGLDIDVAMLLAEKMGVEAELVPITGPNRIPYLQTGRVDMLVASLAITRERSEQVLFSEPYSAIQTVLYARREHEIESYDDLGGLSIGVARASPQDSVITAEAPADTEIRRYDEITAVYQAVMAQQLDGAALGTLIAIELDKHVSDVFETKFVLYQQVQGVAMRLDDQELADHVNELIREMMDSGEMNAINRKWLGSDLPELVSDL